MIVENNYTVKLSEIGKENKVTNKAILSYLEDIGGIHSNKAGYGVYEIPETEIKNKHNKVFFRIIPTLTIVLYKIIYKMWRNCC